MCKARFTFCAALVFLFTFTASSYAGYSGGAGEPNSPYEIATVADWQELMNTPTDWDKHFIMTADIDLNDVPITPLGYFTGVFDGNDHIIRNADINTPDADYVGLFGYVGQNGHIANLGVEDTAIKGSFYVGGLVGRNYSGAVSNCYSTGSVSGDHDVGGLMGYNYGPITNCYSSGSVSGSGNQSRCVGGLVGVNYGTISNCNSTGLLSGDNNVGGLVGENGGAISNCYSTGSVSDSGYYSYHVGGLVGFNILGTISNCYSSRSVNGDYSVGGLVGGISDGIISNCYSTGFVGGDDYVGGLVASNFGGGISNCYSRSSVNGDDYVGGLVGSNYDGGAITNCYSTGSVSGGEYFVGGLVGRDENYNYDAIGSSFWDVNTAGWTTSAGGLGRTTAQMQDIDTFLEAGWDFVAETANGTCGFWLMPDSGGYPLLAGLLEDYVPPEPSGSGTETEPYIVSDANGLGTVWYRPSAHYLLVNDIDLAGIDWSGAIVPFFGGVFDGNDRIISHMEVNTPSSKYVGLFGYVDATGQIKNLGVEDISILGRDFLGGLVGYNCGVVSDCYSTGSVNGEYNVGALLGWNFGAISNCYSTGSVSGGEYHVGGLVGHTWGYSAVISNCYSTGSVTGRWRLVGGLVGGNDYGAITNCYATGSVSGYQFVGGLIGSNGNDATISKSYSTGSVNGYQYIGGVLGLNGEDGTVSNSYSTGSVSGEYDVGGLVGKNESGAINSSFWDVNTSGWPTSAGGTPKTTAEMKTESTFISAGWDFVGESANGTEDIWSICEGTNYPRLVWQIPAADWLCPDGVGLEDFGYFGGYWGTANGEAVNLDGEDGIGFGDLMIFCEEWLVGR